MISKALLLHLHNDLVFSFVFIVEQRILVHKYPDFSSTCLLPSSFPYPSKDTATAMSSPEIPQDLCYSLRDHYSCGHAIPPVSESASLQRVPTCPKCNFRQEIGIPWGCIDYQLVERHNNFVCPECAPFDESEAVIEAANTLLEMQRSPWGMDDTIAVMPFSQADNNSETNDRKLKTSNNQPTISRSSPMV